MTKIKHRFIDHKINPKTELLIIGTFNPDTIENHADFFYGRQRNHTWTLIPGAFNKPSLKGEDKLKKHEFINKQKIDFIDLISEVEVTEVANYYDGYLDNKVTIWRDIKSEIDKLQNLKKICFTRKSFGDVPNMKTKIHEIKNHCETKNIEFQFLTTPARFYSQAKQLEWSKFLGND